METSTVSYLLSNTSNENNNDKKIGNTGIQENLANTKTVQRKLLLLQTYYSLI
jgi:hypothetical protein